MSYKPNFNIESALFAGPKQKWVVVVDKTNKFIKRDKLTLKGVPMNINNKDGSKSCITDKFTFDNFESMMLRLGDETYKSTNPNVVIDFPNRLQ